MEKPEDWQDWGKWPEVMLFTSPWASGFGSGIFKNLNVNYIKDVKILEGNFFFLKRELKKFNSFAKEKFRKEPEWFEKTFNLFDRKAEQLLKLENKENLGEFIDAMVECVACSSIVELLDFALQEYLSEILKNSQISAHKIIFYMHPKRKTPLMEYKEGLKRLDKKGLKRFIKKYKWVGTHGFRGEGLTVKKVKEEIKNTGKNPKSKDAPGRFQKYKNLIKIGSELAYFRSYFIESIDKVGFSYWNIMKKLAKENQLSWKEITTLTECELKDLWETGVLTKSYKKRKNMFGLLRINGKTRIITGKEVEQELKKTVEKIDEKIDEIKGMPAYRGLVKGIVKIIENAEEISKLKKGEILVANETTPDFVPAMTKASAIVTNQGGITCHAAIISRELGIPCIIGTKIATKVLKDGDLVEVDANKGVVKKINSKSKILH